MRVEALVALTLVACDAGPPDPRAGCEAIAHAWCKRVWDLASQGCADAVGITGSFASEADCEADFEFRFVGVGPRKCADISCGSLGYSPSHANRCVGSAGSIACSPDIARSALDCANICCALAGATVGSNDECCSGSTHEIAGFNCGSMYVPPSLVCN